MNLSILGVIAVLTMAASSAWGQPASEAANIHTFRPGEVGPYFCPTGHLRSATTLPPRPAGVSIVKGKNGPNNLLTMGVGGPTCIEPASGDPATALACFTLSKASQTEVRVEVDCGKP
jgi:hypothetical protein